MSSFLLMQNLTMRPQPFPLKYFSSDEKKSSEVPADNKAQQNSETMEEKLKKVGLSDRGDLCMMGWKCRKCGLEQVRLFFEKAIETGVVVIRCEQCSLHRVIRDNLGWIKDENDQANIFEIIKQKREENKRIEALYTDQGLEFTLSDKEIGPTNTMLFGFSSQQNKK